MASPSSPMCKRTVLLGQVKTSLSKLGLRSELMDCTWSIQSKGTLWPRCWDGQQSKGMHGGSIRFHITERSQELQYHKLFFKLPPFVEHYNVRKHMRLTSWPVRGRNGDGAAALLCQFRIRPTKVLPATEKC
jgi:hypothetical protein